MRSMLKRTRPILVAALGLALLADPVPALFAPRPAAAATVKKKRGKKKVRRKAKKASAKKAGAGGAGTAVPKKADEKKAVRTGPASLSEMQRGTRDMSREAQADEKRQEAIDQLKKIIPKITDPSQKADLLFQLAELWWEKSKFVYFREMEDWDKAYAKWMEATGRGEKMAEPKADHRESEIYRSEAIKLYRSILDDYPAYPRNDEVLFNLAYNMYETDRKKEAVALYWDLIKKHPRSRFIPDAYLQMGEHFFNSNDVVKAQKAYQHALDTGEPRVKNFAIYKLAWCDYNVGEYRAALEKFETVVGAAEKAEAENASLRGKIQLKQEALRDMVLTYTMLDVTQPAIQYYEQHAGKNTHKFLASLAGAYFMAGKNEEAIEVYRYVINRDPNHKDAPEYQSQIVRAYAAMQERQQVLAEMERLVDIYGPNGPWANYNKDDKDALDRAYELTEGTQRELVTEYHQEAQKTKYAETYRLAAEIYKRYLEKFSDSEHAYDLRFYYAEILFTLQEYDDAATQYLKVVQVDPNGRYTLTAAYNALLSYEKLAAIDRGELAKAQLSGKQKVDENKAKGSVKRKQILRRASKEDKAEAIPKWEQKQIEASDAYVSVIDQWREKNADSLSKKQIKDLEGDEIAVRYKAAFLFYEHRHYEEAATRFEDIILKWPADQWATKAADLILDSLNTKEAWQQLNDLARKFRKNRRLVKGGGKTFSKRLDELIEGSQFKIVLDLNAAKKYAKAAVGFRDFVEEFPKSKYADTALYNAMVIFGRAKELDKAVTVGEQLVNTYETSPIQPKAILALSSYYEQIADYTTAARYYETYVDRYADTKGKWYKRAIAGKKGKDLTAVKDEIAKALPDALFNAGLWHEGLGRNEKAIADYRRYAKDFKSRDDAPDVYFNVALIYERQKDWQKAADVFETYVKDFGKRLSSWQVLRARYRAAQAYEKLGDTKSAVQVYEALVKAYPKLEKKEQENPVLRDAVAHAAFRLLDPQFESFVDLKFDTTNGREVQKRLAQKTKLLADLEKRYAEVLAYGSGDWGIAALTRIGLGYQDFSRSLLDAPMPPGLDMDQQELYRSILEEKAFPLEEKAIEALEKALAKSYELGVYNDWTIKAQNVLLAFKPNAYGKIHEPNWFGSEFFITAPLIAELAEEPVLVEPEPQAAPAVPGEAAPAAEAGDREARR